ncbi:MAG: SpoVG family protein [Endomicrobium sp.]|uniref:septation protein SpoVG family protein n=1 Tax=Candidatus Endomicrobiellum pyrsonymphae TaxID=1408203 RepID=UPI00358AE478|nr:SpoVG family protein [Endomicrobium sp.]
MTKLFLYIRVLVLFLIVSLGFCSTLYAELQITKVSKNDGSFDVVLNDDIKISNIILKNNEIEFPVYKDKNKVYKQFSILKREFRQYVVDSLIENKISSKTTDTSFKINKFSILENHKTIKVFASVIFNDDIEVECRIMRSKNCLWVAWPANKNNNIWVKDFKFINRNLKETIEKKLITDYTSISG